MQDIVAGSGGSLTPHHVGPLSYPMKLTTGPKISACAIATPHVDAVADGDPDAAGQAVRAQHPSTVSVG